LLHWDIGAFIGDPILGELMHSLLCSGVPCHLERCRTGEKIVRQRPVQIDQRNTWDKRRGHRTRQPIVLQRKQAK
jgi:hypothetical protein